MVISEHYHIVTKYWQAAATHTYDLSIIVGVHSLFYSITNENGDLCLFKEYDKSSNNNAIEIWQAILEKDNFLAQTFNSVKLAYNSPYIVLMPDFLFQPKYNAAYIESTFAGLNNADLYFNHAFIDSTKVAVFALPKQWYEVIHQSHENLVEIQHVGIAWLKYLQAKQLEEKALTPKVYLHVVGKMLHITVFEKGVLLYFNSFTFNTTDDFLYYTLLVYQVLQLDAKTVPLYCSGALAKDSRIFKLLYQYIKYLDFLPLEQDFSILKAITTKGCVIKTNISTALLATDLEASRNSAEFLPQAYWDLFLLSIR